MWCLRRMLRVPWTAKMTNEEVLRRAGVDRELLKTIRQRQLQFLGHLIRARELEYDCLVGRIEGTRARGRQRKKYMDCIREDLQGQISNNELIRMADDRERWRSMVADVT